MNVYFIMNEEQHMCNIYTIRFTILGDILGAIIGDKHSISLITAYHLIIRDSFP